MTRQEHYDTSEALSCLLHSSIALHKDIEARPLSLEKCLDTFTAQEDIKEVGGGSLTRIPDDVAVSARRRVLSAFECRRSFASCFRMFLFLLLLVVLGFCGLCCRYFSVFCSKLA